MDAFTAHSGMSKQAMESERLRSGLKELLLGPGQLYEALRAKGEVGKATEQSDVRRHRKVCIFATLQKTSSRRSLETRENIGPKFLSFATKE